MRLLPVVGLVLGLAACSDPLAGVDRLSEVDVVATDPAAAALPDADEVAREGFLGTSAAEGEVPEGVPVPEARVEPPKSGGFLRGLINRAAAADPAAAIAADVAAKQPAFWPVNSNNCVFVPDASHRPTVRRNKFCKK